jgi:hypothetical protein
MPREHAKNHERERIAHLAARIMAEDGIDDHGLAKRKAARQAGINGSRNLPTNEEIDDALRAYLQIYQGEAQQACVNELRLQALTVMQVLASFAPHLTGPVLSGTAGKFSGISLQLFADSVKEVEWFLLNQGISYRCAETRLFIGDEPRELPVFVIDADGVEVRLTVLGGRDQRALVKATAGGRPIERAREESVRALVSAAPATDAA